MIATNLPILKDNIQITMSFHLAVKDASEKITMYRVHPQRIYVLPNCTECGEVGYGFSVWQGKLKLNLTGIASGIKQQLLLILKILILIFQNPFHCRNKSLFTTVVFCLEIFWVDKSNKTSC